MPEDQNNQGRIYRPNTFQMPNVMVDVWLTELSGSEFKVAAYICRHTYGWNKESDGISLSQMMNGVRRRDGTYLDRGTGIKSKETLLTALRSLEKQRRIRRDRRRSIERGDEPTVYRLVIVDEEPPEDEVSSNDEGSQKIGHPVGGKSDQGGGENFRPGGWAENPTTQNTLEQNTSLQNTSNISNSFELLTQESKNGSLFEKSKKRDNFDKNDASEAEPPEPQRRSQSRGLTPIADALSTRAQKLAPRSPKTAKNPPSVPKGDSKTGPSLEGASRPSRGRPKKYPLPPDLELFTRDITTEFHDLSKLPSNLSFIGRVLEESGLTPSFLYQLMQEARQLTKGRGDINKPSADDPGFRNRFPYFRKTLIDLIEKAGRPVSARRNNSNQRSGV